MPERSSRERRWRGEQPRKSHRSLLVALVLAAATLMTLDQQIDRGPLEPARTALGEAFGPVETATSAVVRPFTSVPSWLRSKASLREDLRDLEAENAELRQQVAAAGYERNLLAEFEGLTRAASDLGRTLVPARVVGVGPAQSFTRTVTIDAGSDAGLRPDLTVVNNDGLVGRVLRVTRRSATVLLAVDAESVVGGRLGRTMELGFVRGTGDLGDRAKLSMELVDERTVPDRGDTVLTWGSDGAGPYVPGVPVGRVGDVYASVRDQSTRADVEPFVDFSALDVVGVVVPGDTASDRALIEADGGIG